MPPNEKQPNLPTNDAVWITREEYDRLRQAEAQQQITESTVVGHVSMAPAAQPTTKRNKTVQNLAGLAISIGLFISLTSSSLRSFALIPLAAMLTFAGFSITDLQRSRREKKTGIAEAKTPKSIYQILLTIGLIIIVAPVIFFGGMILIIIIALSSSGNQGS